MTDATFEKIGRSNRCLYGPRKLLLCGFLAEAQSKFRALLEMLGLNELPLVWASEKDGTVPVGRLMQQVDGRGEGNDSQLPRAVIVAGIEEHELHRLMSACRQAGMQKSLWATLTPTSETWTLGALLAELSAEHDAMAARAAKK